VLTGSLGQRTAEGTAESLAIDPKFKELLQLMNGSDELRREGGAQRIARQLNRDVLAITFKRHA
jgi:hypothetical protein